MLTVEIGVKKLCPQCRKRARRIAELEAIIAETRKELLRTTWPMTTQDVLVGCLQRALVILSRVSPNPNP